MLDLCKLIFGTVIDLLRSRATLEAEVVVLRQQINVLRRASPKRRPFGAIDRLILGGVCRLFPKSYDALAIVRPDTVIRWHRAGSDCSAAGNRDAAAADRLCRWKFAG
jgi:hypothetical protein